MDECISCGYKALYRFQSCKVSFCEEHKGLHERNKGEAHILEAFGIKLDYRQTAKIVENLALKINKVNEFKERIMLETRNLIWKIEELRRNYLKDAERTVQCYMNLLQIIQNPITAQDLQIIVNQVNVSHSINITTHNFQEVLKYYNSQVFEQSPEISIQRLEELKSMDVENIKQALAQEFNLILEGHTESVDCIAVTSDSKYIISGSSDNTLRIWNFKDRRQECVLRYHDRCVNVIAATRDNKYIVAAYDNFEVIIWDLQQKIQVAILNGHTDDINCIAVTSDNQYIASGSNDKTVRLWDFQNKNIYAVLGDTLMG